jgi:hypothetical protein
MKSVIGVNGEEIKAKEGSAVEPFHAYISLTLAMLKEPFVSSDAKYLIIQSSFSYLKDMGYSDEQIEAYIKPLREVVKKNIVINSFMG